MGGVSWRGPRSAVRGLIPLLLAAAAACSGPRATAGTIEVQIQADGSLQPVTLAAGSTVRQALDQGRVALRELDRVDPPAYAVLTDGTLIRITRVDERFEVETLVLPFERQTVRHEGIPEGETRLLQPGQNGVQEITYRILIEEGVEVSRSPVKSVVLEEPRPEILMIGTRAAYAPLPIDGALAYLSNGSAWVLRGDTGNRRPLVLSGDLDGRVFRLSPDGRWLLFSRRPPPNVGRINSLWVVSTLDAEAEPFPLGAENVVHFADWSPAVPSLTVAYSTVEPSPVAPGWQANNDLILVTFTTSGAGARVGRRNVILPPNAGGQYGWWGTTFAWAWDGERMAYARPDGVGIIDLGDPGFEPVLEVVPFQTLGDWAWVPGIAWGRDNRTLFAVDHGEPTGLESAPASPVFHLVAVTTAGGVLPLAERSGMFAYPTVSPPVAKPSGEAAYRVAYLQAIDPLDSADSHYRLMVMDRDGSNRGALFPPPGEPGLTPQVPAWSPQADRLAMIYQGDLWIIDVRAGLAQRVVGGGQVGGVDWKP
jgi:hypothetical protein